VDGEGWLGRRKRCVGLREESRRLRRAFGATVVFFISEHIFVAYKNFVIFFSTSHFSLLLKELCFWSVLIEAEIQGRKIAFAIF
jgi:hypothetical protein